MNTSRSIFLSYSLGEVVAKGLNLLLVFVLPFLLTQEEFGRIALLIATEAIGFVLISGGGGPTFLRLYGRLKKYPHVFLLSACLGWLSWALPATIVLFTACSVILTKSSNDGSEHLLNLALAIHILFLAFRENVFSILRIETNIRLYLALKILAHSAKFLLAITLTQLIGAEEGYVWACLISNLIGFATLISYGRQLLNKRHRFNRAIAGKVLQFGAPLLLSGLSIATMSFGDRFLLEWQLGSKEVAIYSLASSVAGANFFLLNMLTLTCLPNLFSFKRFCTESARYLRKMTTWGIACVLGTSVFLYLLFMIVGKFYLPDYNKGLPIMPLLLAKFGLLPLFLHGQYILMLNSRTGSLPAISFLACSLNVGLNWLWVSPFGIVGAAWASLISESCSVIAVNAIAYRSVAFATSIRASHGRSKLLME